jgi:hypothetical protein
MVKNTKGGKGAKSMARKSVASGDVSGFPLPSSDMEQFALVTKMYGPSCDVILNDGTNILCHIRNKFKGRNKSRNLISVGSLLLIGFRDWEPSTSRKNCDLLFVYDSSQKSSLEDRFVIPSSEPIHIHHDLLFDSNYTTTISHDDVHDQHPIPITLDYDYHNDFSSI